MLEMKTLGEDLQSFRLRFDVLAKDSNDTLDHNSELEVLLDEYSKFILDEKHNNLWEQLSSADSNKYSQLLSELRKTSAQCVARMEKYRALRLLEGHDEGSGYFNNIESCIQQEFGCFEISSNSKVLLIGSGSFPMTPLLIAKQTGAEVVGIDIDEEAVKLGRRVIEKLGSELNVRLEQQSVEDLGYVSQATHIIFSSTVEKKYEILNELHALTKNDVVAAMRYGNKLKSLFNYPMKNVNQTKWRLVDNTVRPDQIFDIALYEKA
ncbi:methyltransferase domain-containing protein [Halobacillus kuroshimensis]|uniref:methyltransferase domain-containing protein n=1 Tax=Halobacillus kuroshimensis TaxID=302481 RepID=UPI0004222D47|nr:methyltransferase domain-containing protein [Halobacillus kuroshimensis]